MKKTIAICASISFYKEVVDIKNQLVKMGYGTRIPELARVMEESGNFDLEAHRLKFYGDSFHRRKGEEMRRHFEVVASSDAVLVVNKTKHGIEGYIGPNVLMEMAIAFEHRLPIFILNPLSEDTKFEDEILAMEPVFLGGKLKAIKL